MRTVQRSELCRSRRELSNEYLLAKFGFDTAENEHCKVCLLFAYRSPRYWAVTTMSTVGYGDLIPTTAMERGYTMFAMIAGASFYGYMIGNITSIVAEGDAHTKAYYEKMKKISAWCDHQEFPRLLRRRVRRLGST